MRKANMRKPKNPVPGQPNLIKGTLALLLNGLVVLLVVLAFVLGWAFLRPGAALSLATPSPAPTAEPQIIIIATPTITPPCNWAALVYDADQLNGISLRPGEKFTQTWRVKNIGTCIWNADYELFFVRGKDMGDVQSQKLGTEIAPGQTVDIAIELTAPVNPGGYVATYMLRSDDGTVFGLDFDFDQPLWVAVNISE